MSGVRLLRTMSFFLVRRAPQIPRRSAQPACPQCHHKTHRNDAHKYLREPPPVKAFSISLAERTFGLGWLGLEKKMERSVPGFAPFQSSNAPVIRPGLLRLRLRLILVRLLMRLLVLLLEALLLLLVFLGHLLRLLLVLLFNLLHPRVTRLLTLQLPMILFLPLLELLVILLLFRIHLFLLLLVFPVTGVG